MSTYFVKLLGARSVRLRVDDGEMLVIGRADEADLQLEDKLVSRQHCEIEVRSGSLIVRDLGSRNGTVLNGRRFAGERVAHPGDQVKVGSHFLLIERNLDSG
ncbi:MAG: FHA domain-containing protein, partial [Planctomycetota bacterium]